MKREFLKGLGLEQEAIDKIMNEYGTSIERIKGDLDSKSSELIKANDKIKELEASTNTNNDYQSKIKDLETQLTTANTELNEVKAEKMNYIKDTKLSAKLKDANVKSIKIVKSLLGDLEFDGEDFTNFDEKIQALKEDEETSMLFNVEEDSNDDGDDFRKVFNTTGIDHSKGNAPMDEWEAEQRRALGLDD